MKKAQASTPRKDLDQAHAAAKKHARAFITRLEARDSGLFAKLQLRALNLETDFIDWDGHSHRKEKGISIDVRFSKSCLPATAKREFKDLINWMELAGHSCRFTHGRRGAGGKTTRYELGFVQESTYERDDRSKPGAPPRNTRRLKWRGEYWAKTDTQTAEISKTKSKDGTVAYRIIIFTVDSRIVRERWARSLKEAQEIVKKILDK